MKETNARTQSLSRLTEVFGAHKAEWLGPKLFDLFAEPTYFPRLITARPCVLEGGRGTGKTTVLRGLSYQGQFAIRKNKVEDIPEWPFFGFYYRVDTNRVGAFQGLELNEIEWTRKFGHYVNLIICIQAMRFLAWFQTVTGISTDLDETSRVRISRTFSFEIPKDNQQLLEILTCKLDEFENHINNVAAPPVPRLSMLGAPIQALMESIKLQTAFSDKQFFILIDEYENLRDYQQKLMNTLIKHSGELY